LGPDLRVAAQHEDRVVSRDRRQDAIEIRLIEGDRDGIGAAAQRANRE